MPPTSVFFFVAVSILGGLRCDVRVGFATAFAVSVGPLGVRLGFRRMLRYRGALLFFSNTTPQFGSLRHFPKKLIWRKIKTATGCKIPWSRYTPRVMKNTSGRNSDDFGLRSPVHSETISAKKRYTSIAARARSDVWKVDKTDSDTCYTRCVLG